MLQGGQVTSPHSTGSFSLLTAIELHVLGCDDDRGCVLVCYQMASQNASDDASVTSSGLVAGDNPIHHSLLLLIIQVGIIICVSRALALLLRPLKQPRVVAGKQDLL